MANKLSPRQSTRPIDDNPSVSNALAARSNPPKPPKQKQTKEMTAAALADKLAPVFADLSARRRGSWSNKQRKDWNAAANLLQKVRGRGRKDPLV